MADLKQENKVKINFVTYYRYNKSLEWICSDIFDTLKLAEKYLRLELKDLEEIKERGDFALDVVEVEGCIVKQTVTTSYQNEVLTKESAQ